MHVCACVCVHKDVRPCEAACELACSTYISPSYLLWYPATSLSRYFDFRRTPMRLLTSNSMGRSGAINWIWKKKNQTPKTIRISLWKLESSCKEARHLYTHIWLWCSSNNILSSSTSHMVPEQLTCCRYLIIQKWNPVWFSVSPCQLAAWCLQSSHMSAIFFNDSLSYCENNLEIILVAVI